MGLFKRKKKRDIGKRIYKEEYKKTYAEERKAYAEERAKADARRAARGGNSKMERLGRIIGEGRQVGKMLFGDMDSENKRRYSSRSRKPSTRSKYVVVKGKAYKVGGKSRSKPAKRKRKDTSMKDLINWQP